MERGPRACPDLHSPGAGSLLGQGPSHAIYPLCNICNPRRVEVLEAQYCKCGYEEDERARPAFSHGSLTVIKWIICCHRETIFLLEARCETVTVPSGGRVGWLVDGRCIECYGSREASSGPFITQVVAPDLSISFLPPLLSVFPCHFSHRHGAW
jgi:hypothetical protein